MPKKDTGYLNVDKLEFFRIKDNLKEFLKGQDKFEDYDFEASNLNLLLELLAYNTYMNNFYNNQVGSEAFLDSARIKESVVSHAKELNYLPRSRSSAEARVDITVDAPSQESLVVIPRFYRFTSTIDNTTVSYTTNESITIRRKDGAFKANDIPIYEGEIVTEFFEVKDNNQNSFPLRSENIDTNSIIVEVINSKNDNTTTEWRRSDSLFGIDDESEVFFIEGYKSNQYKIQFSVSGIFGKKLELGNIVRVRYRDTVGEAGNSAFVFSPTTTVNGYQVSVNTRSASRFGSERESIEDIRYNAPRFFTTQRNGVTAKDYEILTKARFPEIQAVTAYGGEFANPPVYGKVIVSVKPYGVNPIISDNLKSRIEKYLTGKSITREPLIVDPEFFYVEICSKVNYDTLAVEQGSKSITSDVMTDILEFSQNSLNDFGKSLRYSSLVSTIDESNSAIVSNDTKIRMIKRWSPVTTRESFFEFRFGNSVRSLAVPSSQVQPLGHPPMLDSSPFQLRDQNGVLRTARMQDNGRGTIFAYYRPTRDEMIIINSNVGSVDYKTGKISLRMFVEGYSGRYINIYARTRNSDLLIDENRFLLIDPADIEIILKEI